MTLDPCRVAVATLFTCLSLTTPALSQDVFVDPPGLTPQSTAPLTGQRANLARELPLYGYRDVDVRSLSAVQVAHLHHIVHSGRSQSEVRNQIASTLRRGLLQRGFDRLVR